MAFEMVIDQLIFATNILFINDSAATKLFFILRINMISDGMLFS